MRNHVALRTRALKPGSVLLGVRQIEQDTSAERVGRKVEILGAMIKVVLALYYLNKPNAWVHLSESRQSELRAPYTFMFR